ncbi:MAG: glycosyltransferase, partial [Bacillota bacterium]
MFNKIFSKEKLNKKLKEYPQISFIIAAHNEEKVIKKKLENTISLDYDPNKMDVIVASDNSDDKTNEIVKEFIKNNQAENTPKIKLYIVKERKGKTNAQNEAIREASGEIIAFSDANTIW